MDEMGASFVEVTAHGGARPSHAVWQGRRYHRGGAVDYLGQHYEDFESATGYGTGAGLCGWPGLPPHLLRGVPGAGQPARMDAGEP